MTSPYQERPSFFLLPRRVSGYFFSNIARTNQRKQQVGAAFGPEMWHLLQPRMGMNYNEKRVCLALR